MSEKAGWPYQRFKTAIVFNITMLKNLNPQILNRVI